MADNIGKFSEGQTVKHAIMHSLATGVIVKINTDYNSLTVEWENGMTLLHPPYLLVIITLLDENNPNSTFRTLKEKGIENAK